MRFAHLGNMSQGRRLSPTFFGRASRLSLETSGHRSPNRQGASGLPQFVPVNTKEATLPAKLGTFTTMDSSFTFRRRGKRRPLLDDGQELQGGRYRILEVLGSGGEGVVYRAWDSETEQSIALKSLHFDSPTTIPALKREFRILRDLTHPSLVQLRELVVGEEHSFFTMDYVKGIDMLSAIDAGHDPRDLFLRLADVLEFLHGFDRVHRDIKPTNILIDSAGRLTLLDFGVAVWLGQSSGRAFAGTPQYIAPELYAGGAVTTAADAFSVGVLLFEALTGAPPFARHSPARFSAPPPYPEPRAPTEASLLDLCQALLRPNPAERATIGELATHLGRAQFSRSPPASSAHAMAAEGRDLELAQLRRAVEQVDSFDEPGLVLLSGESGMGKSALLEHFARRIFDRATVLRGRCSPHELVAHKAVDGLVTWLHEWLLALDPSEVPEFVSPSDARALLLLFPELATAPGFPALNPRDEGRANAPAARQSAYQALARVLRRISECELLVYAIDDVQWGDVDSARLLREVFCGAERPACLLVLAFREESRNDSECLRELLDGPLSLVDETRTEVIELGPLLPLHAKNVVLGLDPERTLSPALVERLIQDSHGSPLLLTELTSHLLAKSGGAAEEEPSHTLAAVVRARFLGLDPGAREAFDLLCCSGSPLRLRLLAAATGRSPGELTRALTTARLAHLTAGEHSLEPLHDGLREAHLESMTGLRELHGRLADLLADEWLDPAETARHYYAAGRIEEASRFAVVAAMEAARTVAHHRAAELYELALSCHTLAPERRHEIEERLAYALSDCGRGAEAAPIFLRLADSSSGEKALRYRRAAAEQMLITGSMEQGTRLLAEVQGQVGLRWPHSATSAIFQVLKERTAIFWYAGRKPKARPLSAREEEALDACRAGWAISYVSSIHGAANAARYLRLALELGHPRHAAHAYGLEAQFRAIIGPRAESIVSEYMARSEELMSSPKDDYDRAFIPYSRGQISYLFGEFKQSNEYYEEAEPLMLEYGSAPWELTSLRIFWANNLHNLGRARELKRRVDTWLGDGLGRGDLFLTAAMQHWRAHLVMLRENDPDKALSIVQEASQSWQAPYMGVHHFLAQFARIYIFLQAGSPRLALHELKTMERDMKESHMYSIQLPRVWLRNYECTALLAAAASAEKWEKRQLIRRAQKAAERLAREQVLYADALSIRGLALCELARRPGSEDGIHQLRAALALSDTCEMAAYSAGTMLRLGLEIGGTEGASYLARAERAYQTAEAKDWRSAARSSCPMPE